MKKLIALAAITLIILSCSGDDSQSTDPVSDTILLKKAILTNEAEQSITYNYLYNGNKIVSMTGSDGSSVTYLYTDNNITYKKSTSAGMTREEFNEYDEDGKLTTNINKTIFHNNPSISANINSSYTYNEDGTTSVHDIIDFLEGSSGDRERDYQIIYSENTITYDYGGNYKDIYTYDEKNNPMKNVLGFNDLSQNLLTLYTQTNQTGSVMMYDYDYQYNDVDYPVSAILNAGDFNNSIQTYHYQYFYE